MSKPTGWNGRVCRSQWSPLPHPEEVRVVLGWWAHARPVAYLLIRILCVFAAEPTGGAAQT